MAEVISGNRIDDRKVIDLCAEETIYNPWDDTGWEAADDPTFEGLQ